ncbi:hypothetical protein DRQ36_04575 [bacterium]|nr:MAG: hypothetical protein DRQ36_04575 [bacterium]
MKLPEFSVSRPVTISMLIGIIVVLGLFSLYHLGLEMLPDISYPVVSVLTRYPAASPEDVEESITRPIEQMVASVSRVKSLNSISQEGLSIVMIEFTWGTNLDFAAQDVRDAISMYSAFLPDDATDPTVLKFDVSMMPMMVMTFSGMDDLYQLREILEDRVSGRLERLDGVASAVFFGGERREILVELDPVRLEALKLSTTNIIQALRFNNLNLPAGRMDYRRKEFLVRTAGEFESLADIGEVVVGATSTYEPVFLKDIADIRWSSVESRGVYETNGEKAVWMMVIKESGANTVTVTNRVKKALEDIRKIIPPEIKYQIMFEMADFIERIATKTWSIGLMGGLLAIIMIYLFLRNWRPTLAISLAIPLSVIAAFIAMYAANFTLNLTTMGGLALGVGMLVDNAIVVIENIYRHMEEGEHRLKAASLGASEVGMAITASTLTTIAVFFPLLFAGGITGKLSEGYALTVTFSLLASLFVALTLVPMIASKIFRPTGESKAIKHSRRFDVVRKGYQNSMRWSLKHPVVTLGVVFLLILGSVGLVFIVGAEFIPSVDSDMARGLLTLPTGSSLNETVELARYIADKMAELEDVEFTGINVGMGEGSEYDAAAGQGLTGSNEAEIIVRLKDKSERTMTNEEIGDYMRGLLPPLKGVELTIMDIGRAMMGNTSSGDIELKIYGNELDKLVKIAKTLKTRLIKVKGITDLNIDLKEGKPEYVVRVDRSKAANYGLSVGEIAQAVNTYTQGSIAGHYRAGGKEYDIRVRFPKAARSSLEDLYSLPIITRMGASMPLEQVASINEETGPLQIFREDQSRIVTLSCNITGRSVSATSKDVKAEIERLRAEGGIPANYYIELAGEYENLMVMVHDLSLVTLAALLLIYMIMAAQFESFSHPFVIMFTVPLAIVGVIIAIAIAGYRVNLPSALGFLILSGIVVNNGIVFVDYINQLRRKGVAKLEAIVEAGGVRLRPILITALTTILGMLPMALDKSEGAEIRSPMATAIIGGLISATLFTLFVIPVIYSSLDRFAKGIQKSLVRIFHGEKESEEMTLE